MNTHFTCFEKHYLIILTELHEAVDALGKLHHILNGLCDFNGTQLPHDFPGLRGNKTKPFATTALKTLYSFVAVSLSTLTILAPKTRHNSVLHEHFIVTHGPLEINRL